MRRRTALLMVTVVGMLGACARREADPRTAVPTSAQPQGGDGSAAANEDGAPLVLSSRDDLLSYHPIVWSSWRLVDPRTIEVSFSTGVPECYGIHVQVDETERDVTITLSGGSIPQGDHACPDRAVQGLTRVELAQELGDREVRQGA